MPLVMHFVVIIALLERHDHFIIYLWRLHATLRYKFLTFSNIRWCSGIAPKSTTGTTEASPGPGTQQDYDLYECFSSCVGRLWDTVLIKFNLVWFESIRFEFISFNFASLRNIQINTKQWELRDKIDIYDM